MASPTGLLHRPNNDEELSASFITDRSSNEEMSYADAAKKGPQQAEEDSKTDPELPQPVPELTHEDNTPKQPLNAPTPDPEPAQPSKSAQKAASQDFHAAETKAKATLNQASQKASETSTEVKEESQKAAKKVEKKAKDGEQWADKNKSNPVVIGNLVVVAALGALLGTGAYRMQKAGTLTYKVAGAWAGAVGLFALGDYFVSQWLFKNKYPPRQ
ncbi:hypothetical protein LTR62_004324 [Meristemomyces frigidus]|uniref:Mitochondrial outer membrane protein OM14 C-terminal domain-containing protein n=1 Tax=Meristemomyces frigidus TaxID=1508187 RepID=A0AAN7TQZ6_9PEZI|nr:hypothetical protein LTR62_004324 [Meristemomyces frigidus]